MVARVAAFAPRPRHAAVVVGAVLASAMAAVAVARISDPDVWWVAAAGREMLAGHGVPRENLFSFAEPHHPWVMHEWLFGPVYAWGLAHFGPVFFDAAALVAIAVNLALVAKGTMGRAREPLVGLGMLLAAMVLFGARFLSARPTGVALGFPLAMTLVAFAPRFTWKRAALAVLLELAWTNAHGSFPLGVVLLVVSAVDADEERATRLVAAGLAALATLVNPYGLALHRFVWAYARGDAGITREIHAHIREFGTFAAAWGYTVGPVDLVGLVASVGLALFALTRAGSRARGALCLALLGGAVVHARHLELAGLVSVLLLTPVVDALVPARAPSTRIPPTLVLAPACLAGLVALLWTASHRAREESVAAGADFFRTLDAVPDDSRLVVPFPTAGLALWYAFPRGVRVLYDSRNDCYSPATFAAAWTLDGAQASSTARRAALAASNADTALVPAWLPLRGDLARDPDWTLIREAGSWSAFRRAAPPATAPASAPPSTPPPGAAPATPSPPAAPAPPSSTSAP